jgi:hypothetical protein
MTGFDLDLLINSYAVYYTVIKSTDNTGPISVHKNQCAYSRVPADTAQPKECLKSYRSEKVIRSSATGTHRFHTFATYSTIVSSILIKYIY